MIAELTPVVVPKLTVRQISRTITRGQKENDIKCRYSEVSTQFQKNCICTNIQRFAVLVIDRIHINRQLKFSSINNAFTGVSGNPG